MMCMHNPLLCGGCVHDSGAVGDADEAAPPGDVCEGAGKEEAAQLAAGHAVACEGPAWLRNAAADADHCRAAAPSCEEALS